MPVRIKLPRRAAVLGATLAALTLALAAGPAVAGATSASKTALLNGESVTTFDGIKKGEEPISLEQYAAEQAGFTVTVKSGPEWEAMTAPEFASYQVLIIGDPKCSQTAVSAVKSAHEWTPVVMGTSGLNPTVGNRAVVGTDPEYHYAAGGGGARPSEPGNPASAGAEHLVQDGITFAGAVDGATGVYFDTSCTDLEEGLALSRTGTSASRRAGSLGASLTQEEVEGPDGLDKTLILNHLTASTEAEPWTENVQPPCGGNVQQIADVEAFKTPVKLEDSDIQGWSCSDHITFPTFPTDWHALAVATDTETTPTCGIDPHLEEIACGQAYVLLAGRGIVAKSGLTLTPESGSDPAGGEHAVTAQLLKKKTEPVVGVPVAFVITELNAGVTGTCTTPAGAPNPECKTDETGSVKFTYKDVNGVGQDTINASATVEVPVVEKEIGARAAARMQKITEQATATETWTAVPATPAPAPAPAAQVLAAKVVVPPAKGTARAASIRGCIAQSSYLASVRGTSIASVTFTLDGHAIKTLRKPTSGSTFTTRVGVRSGSVHHLAMRVVFTSASKTPTATFRKTIARCAARKVVLPRFTG
ncbi:MAG TPA: hypothetical protein VGO14_09600 [Solirubrobacteraceae bacterium]|jgi:hypothetical protein|nr:hypothetical protein [Solirubrobacteraceae bacterium]